MSERPNLLIVDPNSERLNAMTRFFLQAGFRVTPVAHPRQALEASTFKHFDAAILSDRLPETPATSLARQLQGQISDLKPLLISHEVSQWEEIEDELALVLNRGFEDLADGVEAMEDELALLTSAG